jgi:hypothetical protein
MLTHPVLTRNLSQAGTVPVPVIEKRKINAKNTIMIKRTVLAVVATMRSLFRDFIVEAAIENSQI